MYNNISLILVALLIQSCACRASKEKHSSQLKTTETADIIESNDASQQTLTMTADSINTKDYVGDVNMYMMYPVNASPVLKRAIGEFISESFDGSYNGDSTDFKSMLEYYHKQKVNESHKTFEENAYDNPQGNSLYTYRFTVKAETPKYITYVYTSELYVEMAAHGYRSTFGVTIRKSDGRRFGWDAFGNETINDITLFLKEGLKHYFNVTTDEQLEPNLNESVSLIPLPKCPPIFEEKGITVIYQPYEIACYAAGSPSFTIPYNEMDKYLTETMRQLIK